MLKDMVENKYICVRSEVALIDCFRLLDTMEAVVCNSLDDTVLVAKLLNIRGTKTKLRLRR